MSLTRTVGASAVSARTFAMVVAGCLTLLLLIWASIVLQLRAERRAMLEAAVQRTMNYASVFEKHVERTLRSADVTLSDIESDYRRQGSRLNLARYAASHRMFLDPYTILSIADENGRQILASRPFTPQDLSDRASFRWHAMHDDRSLVISKPRIGKVTGKWSIYISRRIDKPDGTFGGVAAIGLDPHYFSNFYDRIDLGKDAEVALLGRDGVIRARSASGSAAAGETMSRRGNIGRFMSRAHGSYVTRHTQNGMERIVSFRALRDYPLIVRVGVSKAATLAPYYRLRKDFIAWGTLITVIVLVFTALATMQASRQARTARALRASEGRLRAIWNAEPECVTLLDPQCRVIEINAAGAAMAEVENAAALRGKSLLEVIDQPYHGVFRDLVARVFADESGRLAYELTGLKGTRRSMEIQAVPLYDAQEPGRIAAMLGVTRDVTEQKKAQDALLASRRLLQDILDSIYAFVGLFSLDGTLVEVNKAPLGHGGLAREQGIGKPLWETPWFAHSAAARERIRDTMARAGRGETVRYDETVSWRDGTLRHVDLQFGPLRNAAGEVVQIVGFGVDITERREAEADRAHLAYIVQTSDDAIISRSLDHHILSWNGGAERLFGYTREEALGKDVTLLFASDVLARYYMLREAVSAGRPVAPHEVACVTKSGRRIEVSVRLSPVRNETGEVVAVSLIMRDITEQKEAQAQQRVAASVIERAAEGIMITDCDHNVVSVNRAFTDITGFSREDGIAKTRRLLLSAAHPDSLYDEVWTAVRKDGRWRGEVWDRRKSGELYCMQLSVTAVRNERGDVAHYCAIFMDITERKTAEAELKALNAVLEDRVSERTRELEAANRELGAFSYSVSHDLRAPVRAIQGFGTLVLNKNKALLDAESVSRMERICDNAERMGLLIDDLLRLSRVSQREIERHDFDFSRLAHETVGSLRHMEPLRKVNVTIQPGMRTRADQTLLRLVMENLIGNAWKFTSRTDDARIDVRQEQRDGKTVYCVRDNGAGFDMQYAGKLFNAFQRLHHRSEFDGTGIGLSIVHRVIAKHGGTIWADAKVGEGASFYFTLG